MAQAWERKQKWKNDEELQYAIVLNSSCRNNQQDDSSSFTYTFPETLTDITSMKLSAIEIPVDTYFTISQFQGNNVFYITKDNYEVIIPDGNYPTNDDMVDAINTAIKNTWNDVTISNNQLVVNNDNATECSLKAVNRDDYIISFVNDNNDSDISLNFSTEKSDPNLNKTLGWILGFRRAQVDIARNGDILADAAISLTPTKSFLFCVDDYTGKFKDNIKVAFSSSFLNKHVLARIPFIRADNGLRTFVFNKFNDTPINVRLYNGPTNIQKIKVEILDDFGRLISLNNSDYNFVLTFTKNIRD